jgi:1-acyl-sn-glycerol-3-phosphate acyltransferase
MAEVLYNKGKVFSWFLYKIGGIFVNRDACNFSFIEDSKEAINKKRVVGVFPQGRLPIGGKPFPYKPGVVLIALATGAPIIPVYTDGNYGLLKRAHIMIGEEIRIEDLTSSPSPDDAELKRLTSILEEKTYEMKHELEKRINSKNG